MFVVTKTSLHQWGVKNKRCLKKKGSTFDELMWIRFFFHALWRCVQACAFGPLPFSKKSQTEVAV